MMQQIYIIGNLTRDPELKSTSEGVSVCVFNVAVDRRYKKANGEKTTDFFRINAWRQLGDVCGQYLSKGKKVAVIGELQARQYDGNDGKTYMSLDINADRVEFLSPKGEDKPAAAPQPVPDAQGFTDISSDDIPF
jgi:single-strand DNA-binding protein